MGGAGERPRQTKAPERTQAEEVIQFQVDLLNAIEQAVIATDLHGSVVYWNRFAEALYGWSSTEVMGRNILDMVLAPGSRELATQAMAQVRGGQGWSGELIVQRRDGTAFAALVTQSPAFDGSTGRITGFVSISRDINEPRRREQYAKLLADTTAEFSTQADYERLLEFVARRCADLLGDWCAIEQIATDSPYLKVAALYHRDPPRLNRLRQALAGAPAREDDPRVLRLFEERIPRTISSQGPVIHDFLLQGSTQERPLAQRMLAVPLHAGGTPFGVLIVGTEGRHWDDEDLRLASLIADRAGVAIHNAMLVESERQARERAEHEAARKDALYAAQRRRQAEDQLLTAIAMATAGETEIDRMLSAVLDELQHIVFFTGGSLVLIEGDDLVIRAALGPFANRAQGQRMPRGQGRLWKVVETGEPFHSNDLLAAGLTPTTPIRSYIAVPLLWRGHAFGILEVDSTQPNAFDPADLAVMRRVAAALSGSIQLARRYAAETQAKAQVEAARRRLAFLAEASTLLNSALDYRATLASVARLAVPTLADWCAVDVLEEDGRIHSLAVAHEDPAKVEWVSELQDRYPPNPGYPRGAPNVIRTGRSELYPEIPDALLVEVATDAEHLRILRGLGLFSAMVVPLKARGHPVGAITLVSAESGRRYTDDDLALAEDLGHRAGLAMDNARLHQAEQTARRAAERAADRIARLQGITAALSEALTAAQVASVVVEQGAAALGARAGSMSLLTEDRSTLEIVRAVGYPDSLIEKYRSSPVSTPMGLTDAMRMGEGLYRVRRRVRRTLSALCGRSPCLSPGRGPRRSAFDGRRAGDWRVTFQFPGTPKVRSGRPGIRPGPLAAVRPSARACPLIRTRAQGRRSTPAGVPACDAGAGSRNCPACRLCARGNRSGGGRRLV